MLAELSAEAEPPVPPQEDATTAAAAPSLEAADDGGSQLNRTVKLLARCHSRDLQKLGELKGRTRCIAVYR